MKTLKRLLPVTLALALLLTSCAQSGGGASSSAGSSADGSTSAAAPDGSAPDASAPVDDVQLDDVYMDRFELGEVIINGEDIILDGSEDGGEDGDVSLEDGDVPLAATPMPMPEASGTQVKENSRAKIDYSNIKDGYVMVNFTGTTKTRLKVQVSCPTPKLVYTYDLQAGAWTTFPLSDGSGSYTVTILENTSGSKYAQVLSTKFDAQLTDEFAPFLRPNQYVDYSAAEKTMAKAKELAGSETDPLKLVEVVYKYVVSNISYDTQLAATVQSGYLPKLDSVLAAKKGICFEYAALMTGMLRSLGVPCKLVTGYVPLGNGQTGYHAWISVWSEETGWVEGAVYFDGRAWYRMDPTFASSSNSSEAIMQFIGDGSNYSVKYVY